MTTLVMTIPLPALAAIQGHFGNAVVVCTKGHVDPGPSHVAETSFYLRANVPAANLAPDAHDIELIAGCLDRLFLAPSQIVDDYAALIYRLADAFIKERGISAVLFRTGPHLPHEMAIYRIARRDGLKIGIYEETSYFGRAFLFPAMSKRALGTALWSPGQPYALDAEQMAAVADSSKLKEHYFGIYKARRNSYRDVAKSALFATAAVIKAQLSGSPLAGSGRATDNPLRPSLTGALDYWGRNIAGVMRAERYFQASVAPASVYSDLGEDDVIFYGNYAPERTIFPDSYPYHDFISALRLLGDFKTRIWREHPTQFRLPGRPYMLRGGLYKGPKFYDAVRQEGWTIGPLNHPSEALLQSKAMIACLNGTVAFEAMLKRRPLIAFAKNWYLDLPNVSTAGDRSFDLAYDPLDVVAHAFARTFPRIDFWNMQASDLETLARSIDLVRAQTTSTGQKVH